MSDVMTVEHVLELADKLEERANEYRDPYIRRNQTTEFHKSGSAATWAALRDVAMLLRSLVEPMDAEPEPEEPSLDWTGVAVTFSQDMEQDGYQVEVQDNDGIIVKTFVYLHEWTGTVTPMINDQDAAGLVDFLISLNEGTEGPREGTIVRSAESEE